MACRYPLVAWRSRGPKPVVVFTRKKDRYGWDQISLPCGQCLLCRLERSRQWAMRCMHEASLYEENSFITLTYRDEEMPRNGSLVHKDFQDFMKRLRRFLDDCHGPFGGVAQRVRFFMCGEYGERLARPHYHACLFGFDFWDKYVWSSRSGFTIWRSPTLEDLWPSGLAEIGSVTFESAAYVARYITKKVTGDAAASHYERVDEWGELVELTPEYASMSKKPGIGKPWLVKWKQDVYPLDRVVVRGKVMKPPRYYDQLLSSDELEEVQFARSAKKVVLSDQQLEARLVSTRQRLNLHDKRGG